MKFKVPLTITDDSGNIYIHIRGTLYMNIDNKKMVHINKILPISRL